MSEAPAYLEFEPRPSLRPFVQCVWTFDAPSDPAPQPIAPDGCTEFIVHRGRPYQELGGRGLQPSVLFAGQLTSPLTLVARHAISVVGVRFRPDGARGFLGQAMDRATDQRLDMSVEHGTQAVNLHKRVLKTKTVRRATDELQDYVEARVKHTKIDPAVRSAVVALRGGKKLALPSTISQRQFQRRFRIEVGVSPRTLAAIIRFRRVFDAIEMPEHPGWLQAALQAGYFDQAQMARDFQRFLGCTARDWARQRAGLARALTQTVPS